MARASSTGSASVRGFAELADVMCTIVEQGERHAAERLDDLLGRMPIEVWPPRPYLFALPAVYLLAPQTRTALDRCRFGPALEASLAAGRALVALREGDAAPAARLAWDRPQLLRAHVLPCHLGSLVAAVAAVGHADVGPVSRRFPTFDTTSTWPPRFPTRSPRVGRRRRSHDFRHVLSTTSVSTSSVRYVCAVATPRWSTRHGWVASDQTADGVPRGPPTSQPRDTVEALWPELKPRPHCPISEST